MPNNKINFPASADWVQCISDWADAFDYQRVKWQEIKRRC